MYNEGVKNGDVLAFCHDFHLLLAKINFWIESIKMIDTLATKFDIFYAINIYYNKIYIVKKKSYEKLNYV